MALVSRHPDALVLNDVLLDDGLPMLVELGLLHSAIIDVSVGDEAVVPGNVLSNLGSAH